MANVPVKEVLTLPGMRGTEVIAGHQGLNNFVTAVNVMEVPDVEAFVRAGDLLLTTAYPIHHQPELLLDLVKVFHARKLAALAIKPGRYLDELPEGLPELCDRLGFPLLIVRNDLSFDVVIGEVMAVVLADYGEPDRADAIRENLTELALSGGGLDGIARILAKAVLSEVQIVDQEEGPYPGARAGTPIEPAVLESFDITVGGKARGAIKIRSPRTLTLSQRRLCRQAAFAAGLYIAQSQAAVEVNHKLRILALEELISENSQSHLSHALLFGWDLSSLRQVAVASIKVASALPAEVGARIWGRSSHSWVRGDHAVVIFNPDELERPTGAALESWARELGPPGPVTAAGTEVAGGAQLAHSYQTALQALQIAARTGRRAAEYEELGMELLLASINPLAASSFVDGQIGPVVQYDRENRTELVDTLYYHLGSTSGTEAAKQLCIHYNTLKYRLDIIRSLLPNDWESPQRRTALLMALEIERLGLPAE